MFRHFAGLVLGVVLAPALLWGAAWGGERSAFRPGGDLSNVGGETIGAFVVTAGVGIVVGILAASSWISPMAALVAGLGYLGFSGVYLAAPDTVLERLPDDGPWRVVNMLLQTGAIPLLGAILLVAGAMPSRWRSADDEEDDDEVAWWRGVRGATGDETPPSARPEPGYPNPPRQHPPGQAPPRQPFPGQTSPPPGPPRQRPRPGPRTWGTTGPAPQTGSQPWGPERWGPDSPHYR